ncbi:MAG TPA: ferritin-like domain-containing protein [Vicinamibacterales bacterium]|nr:ferritin-like domain-containing protein [Vicinamibacterales bacterium]
MAKIDSLEKLMVEELRELLDAEKEVMQSLPNMAKAAGAEELQMAFREHQQQTTAQLDRLRQVFEAIGGPARGKKCKGMQALIEEGQEMMAQVEAGPARDAVLIASAQKVEHYEMAAYGTLRTWASLLGYEEAAELLDETLNQEKETDARLTTIAEAIANPEAAGEVEVEEDEEERPRATRGRKQPSRSASSGRGSRAASRGGRKTAGGARKK